MPDDHKPALRFAIMTILAIVYETGTVEEIDMADVMRLFGAQPVDGLPTRVTFNDAGWIDAYINFREKLDAELFAYEYDPDELLADINEMPDLADWNPDGKSH